MPLECHECGAPLALKRAGHFCGADCRKAFNNRRAMRGAELYDLFMQMRFDRGNADGLWSEMCARASAYRDADKAKRAGRKSWNPDGPPGAALHYGQHGDKR